MKYSFGIYKIVGRYVQDIGKQAKSNRRLKIERVENLFRIDNSQLTMNNSKFIIDNSKLLS